MRSIRRCSGRALAISVVLTVTLGAPIAALSDTAYASGKATAVAHDDTTPTDPSSGPATTDPATTDPATTDPATTDPAADPDSPTDTATTLASGPPTPGHPTSVTATLGSDQTVVVVSWVAPTYVGDSDISSYTVTSSPGGNDCPHPLFATDSSCTITGLIYGVTYSFTVTAFNDAGAGEPGTSNQVTPHAPVVKPGAPGNVNATANPAIGLGKAAVSWSPVDDGGASVTYSVTGGGSACNAPEGPFPSCVVSGLAPGTNPTFTVSATNSAGTTVGDSASVQLGSTPGIPLFATSTAANGQITLTWNAPSNGGATITRYTVGGNVVGGPGGTTGCGVNAIAPGVAAGTACVINGLIDGDSYVFQIRASNAYGDGAVSGFSRPITIPAAPVSAPTTQPVVTDPTPAPAPSSSAPAGTGGGGATTGTVLLIHRTALALGKPTTKKGATTVAAALTASGITGGVASQPITVLVQDRLKHKSFHTIVTDAAGRASFTFKAQVTTDVELIYAGGPGYEPVTKATTLVVAAPQGCKVKVKTGFGTATASGTCSEAHLPRGTRLQLQYLSGKKWIAAASGKSTSTTLKFSLTLNRTGSYKVRVLLAANSVYGATTLTLPTLRVR